MTSRATIAGVKPVVSKIPKAAFDTGVLTRIRWCGDRFKPGITGLVRDAHGGGYMAIGWILYFAISFSVLASPGRRAYIVLFTVLCVLLCLNVIGLTVVRKYREQYE